MRVTPQGGGDKKGVPRQVPRSPPHKHTTGASYSRVLLIAIVVGLLRLFTKKSKLAIKINGIVYHIKLVLDEEKHNQIHTLGAPHYNAHFQFLRILKDFVCALLSEKCGSYLDLFAGNHLLTAHAKICERMLRHRAVYGGNCGMV